MTIPQSSFQSLIALAGELGCVGVEVRNDLNTPMFDGADASAAGEAAAQQGLRILAVAEVSAFDDQSQRAFAQLSELAGMASACGAQGVSLIPRNDGSGGSPVRRRSQLAETLARFAPVLADHGVMGYIEPLGFASASLRFKAEVVEVIDSLDCGQQFKLVHDTFHHHLAGETQFFPEHTGLIHVSGVSNTATATADLKDSHRGLVDHSDRLDNLGQIQALVAGGFTGSISIEAFAPSVHALSVPKAALSDCFHYIGSATAASAA